MEGWGRRGFNIGGTWQPIRIRYARYITVLNISGWWFGTWLLFFHIFSNVIIPTDFRIFQRETANQWIYWLLPFCWPRLLWLWIVACGMCRGSTAALLRCNDRSSSGYTTMGNMPTEQHSFQPTTSNPTWNFCSKLHQQNKHENHQTHVCFRNNI